MEKDKDKIEEEINENNATQDVDDFKDDKLDETHSENNEEDSDSEEEEGAKYGATGLKKVTRSGRSVHMGGVGIGFANWNK